MCLCHLSHRHVGVLGIGRLVRLPVSPMYSFLHNVQVIQWITYAEVHVKRSVILTDRLGPVMDERTSFASRARAFESTRLLNCFECAFD